MNATSVIKTSVLVLALGLFTVNSAEAQRNRGDQKPKVEQMYPNAERTDPAIKQAQRVQREMQKLYAANDNGEPEEIISLGEAVLKHKAAGAYERAMAYQLIGAAKADLEDDAGAIEAFQKAIDENALSNNSHYQMMLQVAQLNYNIDQFDEALIVLDRLIAETKTDNAQIYALKGGILYQTEKFSESAEEMLRAISLSSEPQESWYQMLLANYMNLEDYTKAIDLAETLVAKNPTDARLIYNLGTMYAQADNYEKATETFEKARAAGQLDERGYRQLYALYMNMDNKENAAINTIEDGLKTGHLKPSAELYNVVGQAYYFSDRPEQAIEAYRKAAAIATDGESALNLARILSTEEQFAESKKMAQDAIAKGLRRPGDAYMVIARAEFGLENRAGIVAAYREAAKYEETKQAAEEWLKKNASR